ncbi:MAG: hypothetical protein ABH864_02800 [archaeon]
MTNAKELLMGTAVIGGLAAILYMNAKQSPPPRSMEKDDTPAPLLYWKMNEVLEERFNCEGIYMGIEMPDGTTISWGNPCCNHSQRETSGEAIVVTYPDGLVINDVGFNGLGVSGEGYNMAEFAFCPCQDSVHLNVHEAERCPIYWGELNNEMKTNARIRYEDAIRKAIPFAEKELLEVQRETFQDLERKLIGSF